jgi:hypothetical protein
LVLVLPDPTASSVKAMTPVNPWFTVVIASMNNP